MYDFASCCLNWEQTAIGRWILYAEVGLAGDKILLITMGGC